MSDKTETILAINSPQAATVTDSAAHGKSQVTDDSLTLENFRSPAAEARIMPFWFWNTRMEPGLIRRQIHAMAQSGIGGFFLHPRQGLETPYLSDLWFERVQLAVQTAKQLSLKVWLYDEFPYPSGMAGGLLTAHYPELKARTLDYETYHAHGGVSVRKVLPLGRVVSAIACPCEENHIDWERAVDIRTSFGVVLSRDLFWRWKLEHCPYSEKRYMADEGQLVLQWTPPGKGTWKIYLGIEREMSGFKYYNHYFDPLRNGAAEAFLQLTHARYEAALGSEFGKTIPGIFTDETEPPEWSPELEKHLLETEGIDLAQCLPALKEDDHPQAHDVRYRLRNAALRLFQDRWETPIARWCKKRNLIWGAEKPTWCPDHFRHVAQPTIDAAHQRAGAPPEPLTADLRSNARAAMASAQQAKTSIVRCECFHSIGWGGTLQDQKWQIDWLAAQGVNRFTPHAFFASVNGLRKHDAAPSFFLETPAWSSYHKLADYTARLSLALSHGHEDVSIAVLHPTESLWVESAASQFTKEEYEWLMNQLMRQHRMFHPVDAQTLLRAKSQENSLVLGWARYQVLLIPPLVVADSVTAQAVNAALETGMTVMMAEPLSDITLDGNSARKIFSWPGITAIRGRDQWIAQLDARLPQTLSVQNSAMNEAESVWCVQRSDGDDNIIFLANTIATEQHLRVLVPQSQLNWREWLLETGDVQKLQTDGEGGFLLHLPAYGSALLVGKAQAIASAKTRKPPRHILSLDGTWQLQTDRPNALRLNHWRAGPSREEAVQPIEAIPARYYDKAREAWEEPFACAENGEAWYSREFTCRHVPEDLCLLVEEGAIGEPWSLEINGEPLAVSAFHTIEFHGENKLACSLYDIVRPGRNEIVLHVRDTTANDGLRTPLHLIGSFGLYGKERRELSRPAKECAFEDRLGAGLPHFSGSLHYTRSCSFPHLSQGTELVLPGYCEDIIELTVNGHSLGTRPWAPYCWTLPFDLDGEAEILISVTTTLLPFIEGQQWDPHQHEAISV